MILIKLIAWAIVLFFKIAALGAMGFWVLALDSGHLSRWPMAVNMLVSVIFFLIFELLADIAVKETVYLTSSFEVKKIFMPSISLDLLIAGAYYLAILPYFDWSWDHYDRWVAGAGIVLIVLSGILFGVGCIKGNSHAGKIFLWEMLLGVIWSTLMLLLQHDETQRYPLIVLATLFSLSAVLVILQWYFKRKTGCNAQ